MMDAREIMIDAGLLLVMHRNNRYFREKSNAMSFVDIDDRMYFRNRSYELAMQPVSTYVTREEFEEAKKELSSLRKKKREFAESFETEKEEREERISDSELQIMMRPLDVINRRIKELSYLINNAQIVEKSSKIAQEEIIEAFGEETPITDGQIQPYEKDSDPNSADDSIPSALYFVKDGLRVNAMPGNFSPFYIKVENEYMGYNRLLLNGWVLIDDSENRIDDISKAWEIRNKMIERERAILIRTTNEKYPNAYAPWKPEDNERLLDLYSNQNKTIVEISEIIGRTPNGISRQIKRLLNITHLPRRKKVIDLEKFSLNPISITSINPEEIPDEQIPDYLDRIKQLEEWAKCVKDYAISRIVETGVCYDGYEIKTTYKTSFSDSSIVMNTIQERFPDLFNSCIRLETITKIKKVLGEENYHSSIAGFEVRKESVSLERSE